MGAVRHFINAVHHRRVISGSPIATPTVLAANRRTEIGVDERTAAAQDALKPRMPGRSSVLRLGGTEWREGDNVMQRVADTTRTPIAATSTGSAPSISKRAMSSSGD
jgi:ATP-dependent exoDNAse (exonuclease V) alpha subunit